MCKSLSIKFDSFDLNRYLLSEDEFQWKRVNITYLHHRKLKRLLYSSHLFCNNSSLLRRFLTLARLCSC